MKRKGYKLAERSLLVLGLIILSLAVAKQTQAKNPETIHGQRVVAVVYLRGIDANNVKDIRARLNHLFVDGSGLDPKAAKGVTRSCGCTASAPDDGAPGFWTCVKGCMADAGVSYYSLIMCGAVCATSETGIGAVACALCVGVSVTVVEVCVMGCASRDGGKGYGMLMEAKAVKQPQPRAGQLQAKLGQPPIKLKS